MAALLDEVGPAASRLLKGINEQKSNTDAISRFLIAKKINRDYIKTLQKAFTPTRIENNKILQSLV
jgi:hypothetical protein